ncbi:DUF4493 domain-containing protein [Imperialibacter roseus]|uniref:DUF4493 domain-containing protein n=1 Tax=Imperialibacter roseus TaxID=1324217 RepID=A0ABZ0IJ14_9BACT|nr:DUF4493 domain-containing protein [Imperialibacter roseus]WOK05008.1 DUF4493 domain-containing protein [Imperialibacter roseus]|tara:strand:- start:3848 stop:5197 length:1350 start_codon:yes stop_codon:yes gene_type:complete
MRRISQLFLMVLFVSCLLSCNKNEDPTEPLADKGVLKLSLALAIDEFPTSGRVAEVVDLGDYVVTIFDATDDTEVIVFDPWSSAPEEIELETGEYYIEAHSNNLVDAAFNNPYYFGRSDNFTIDKEEIKEIPLTVTLANYKVSVVYSDDIKMDFDTYGMVVTYNNTGEQLDYGDSEELEGYFRANNPIFIEISMTYFKVFDGTTIDRTLTATIDNPQPRTHYRINADAHLDDGKIVININIDDGVDVVDITPAEVEVLNGPATPETIGASFEQSFEDERGFPFGELVWTFSDIALANNNAIYWSPVIGGIKASMDGDGYDDLVLNETLDFVEAESNRGNGVLVWQGLTQIPLFNGSFQPNETRMEMSIFDGDGVTPRGVVDPATLGMPASIGGMVPIVNSGDSFVVKFKLLSKSGANWVPYLDTFDAASTPPDAGGTAYSSFEGGFFWE